MRIDRAQSIRPCLRSSYQSLLGLTATFSLFGCGNAFYMESYDLAGTIQKAAIIVSEPQVYERSALINDRSRELNFLETRLDNSVNEDFKPTLVRNLEVVQSLSSALNITADPAGGIRSANDLALSERTNELQLLQLETQLVQARQALLAAQAPPAAPSTPPPASNGGSSTGTGGGTTPAPITVTNQSADVTTLQTKIAEMEAAQKTLKTDVEKLQATASRDTGPLPGPRVTSLESSPIEAFRDLEAYRAELRQSIATMQLDDSHDVNGNSLYRMQFQLTVLPGRNHNRWAMVDVQVEEPSLDEREVAELYFAWLNHINFTLNRFRPGDSVENDERLITLGRVSGLYQLLHICVDDANPNANACKNYIYLAVPATDIKERTSGNVIPPVVETTPPSTVESSISDLQKLLDLREDEQCVQCNPKGFEYLRWAAATVFQSSFYQDSKVLNPLRRILTMQTTAPHNQDSLLAPGRFKKFVQDTHNLSLARVSTYTASPAEMNQLVSSASNVSNAVELALNLKQSAGPSGLFGSLNNSFKRSTTARIETLERLPRVVSYASGMQRTKHSETPGFGWILGPKAVPSDDGRRVEFAFSPEPQRVFAELSIPSWWPKISFKVRTSWVGENWVSGGPFACEWPVDNNRSSACLQEPYVITKQMRAENGDFEALTNALALENKLSAIARPLITHLYPAEVGICAQDTTFSVRGSNLWRDAQVFMAGKPAKSISVLPGMSGLEATFNMAELWREGRVNSDEGYLELDVYTRDGTDYRTVELRASEGNDDCIPPRTGEANLALAGALPYVISGASPMIQVSGDLPDSFFNAQLGIRIAGSASAYRKVSTESNIATITRLTLTQRLVLSTADADALNGQAVEMKLFLTERSGDEEKQYAVDGTRYFLKENPVIKTTKATMVNGRLRVALEYPPHFEDIFRIDPRNITYTAIGERAGGATLNFTVEPVVGSSPAPEGTLKDKYVFELVPVGASADAFQALAPATNLSVLLTATNERQARVLPPIARLTTNKATP